MSNQPEFDKYSASYRELLRDPVRDRFAANDFFHVRKRDLIRAYFANTGFDPSGRRYLDVGCGKGELLSMLAKDFAYAAGCDPSSGMLESAEGAEVRLQEDPARIPFPDAQFDFVTAVCVYHHVVPAARASLTSEIRRLLRPGGIFAIIEHNPWNPVTRLIVSRLPIDADAVLLPASETRALLRNAGFQIHRENYFLYFPEKLYQAVGAVERVLRRVPAGGQYAVFGRLT